MQAARHIAMLDLAGEQVLYGPALHEAVDAVLRSGHYVLGPNVEAFEREFAAYCGAAHGVSVANGTEAIHLALRALDLGPGDEVIVPAFTFIGTAEPVSYAGATPVFVDVEPDTFNIDPVAAERAITPRTRAVIAVHLFGQCADLGRLARLCAARGIALVEDCAQSVGADWDGRRCGGVGVAGCFSFYPTKNLGACGDGGMVVTQEAAFAEKLRALRNHGRLAGYRHEIVGYNSRLDELQAAILRVKLGHVDRLNALRRERAARYGRGLAGSAVVVPREHGRGRHVYHQYTIRSPRRDAIRTALDAAGISSMIYYPLPLHRQPAYATGRTELALANAERLCGEVLSLPLHPLLTDEQVDRVCDAVTRA